MKYGIKLDSLNIIWCSLISLRTEAHGSYAEVAGCNAEVAGSVIFKCFFQTVIFCFTFAFPQRLKGFKGFNSLNLSFICFLDSIEDTREQGNYCIIYILKT